MMTSNTPTSVRFPQHFIDYADKCSEVLKDSGLSISCSRNDLFCMIIGRHIMKTEQTLSNELFSMILDNVNEPNSVDAYTVRGIVSKITNTPVTDSEFNNFVGVL